MLIVNYLIDHEAIAPLFVDGELPEKYLYFEEIPTICTNKTFDQFLAETEQAIAKKSVGTVFRPDGNGQNWKLTKWEAMKTDNKQYSGVFLFFYAPVFH